MNFEIVKLVDLSGRAASIYSVYLEEFGKTLFERFVEENEEKFPEEIEDIFDQLFAISQKYGARENYFKHYEGKADLVCAIYDRPEGQLRLYCIREGMDLVLLGGGGPKPSHIKAWQEEEKLREEVERMMKISKIIGQRIRARELGFSIDNKDYQGNLEFYEEEE